MSNIILHEKKKIRKILEKDPYLHIYSIGDLDDLFWPNTIWFGYCYDDDIDTIVLIYTGSRLPTVIGLSKKKDTLIKHLSSIQHLLPSSFYAHLSPGVETVFENNFRMESKAPHFKMALKDTGHLSGITTENIIPINQNNLSTVQSLYDDCYPGNWFDPGMLKTNQYFGIRQNDVLIAVAGVHVYSPEYKAAALGNIVTRNEYRNQGYASQVTAALCKSLAALNLRIGLNVKTGNEAAVKCYKNLGFEIHAEFGEYTFTRKG